MISEKRKETYKMKNLQMMTFVGFIQMWIT